MRIGKRFKSRNQKISRTIKFGMGDPDSLQIEHKLDMCSALVFMHLENFVKKTKEVKQWEGELYCTEIYMDYLQEGKKDTFDILTLKNKGPKLTIIPDDTKNKKSETKYQLSEYIDKGDRRMNAQALSVGFLLYLTTGKFGYNLDKVKKIGFRMYLGKHHSIRLESDLTKLEDNLHKYTLFS